LQEKIRAREKKCKKILGEKVSGQVTQVLCDAWGKTRLAKI
jgi:hypothetical protein